MEKETLLHRQVHPSFVQADKISVQVFITSQVFKPTPKDDNKLSVYNSEKFTAKESFSHFVSEPKNNSIGVVSVNFEECNIEELTVVEDNLPFDGHCHIDFKDLTSNQVEKKAKKLKIAAINRGWQYKAE
ncbi:MAG: hypothetical protein QM541_06070 [Flavobacterium sp.]|nr:hypothetical protein [Flavobacterium sp.]